MNTVSSDKTRIRALDVLRGLTVLSMVAFHTAYDLAYIFELPVPWFTSGPVQDIWRNSISWTFLFLAGWMCAYSRNNFKRAIRYGAFAILIWFATTLAAVDTPINFGIIYCMSVSTLLAALLRHVTKGKLNSKSCLIAAAACLVLFFCNIRALQTDVCNRVSCLARFSIILICFRRLLSSYTVFVYVSMRGLCPWILDKGPSGPIPYHPQDNYKQTYRMDRKTQFIDLCSASTAYTVDFADSN